MCDTRHRRLFQNVASWSEDEGQREGNCHQLELRVTEQTLMACTSDKLCQKSNPEEAVGEAPELVERVWRKVACNESRSDWFSATWQTWIGADVLNLDIDCVTAEGWSHMCASRNTVRWEEPRQQLARLVLLLLTTPHFILLSRADRSGTERNGGATRATTENTTTIGSINWLRKPTELALSDHVYPNW